MGNKTHTTETLRKTLFDTIEGVITGDIEEKKAMAIANLSSQIVKTGDLEMRYSDHVTRLDKNDMTPGPMVLGTETTVPLIENE